MCRLAVLSAVLLVLVPAHAKEPVRLAPDRGGIQIATDTVLAPGVHLVTKRSGAGCLVIRTDGVTLDLGGATLRGAPEDAAPDGLSGVGILVEDAVGVTIRSGSIAGFKVGIRAVNARGLVVEDVDASGNFKQRLKSTPEKEQPSDWLWPHENDEGEWEAKYGAGISLNDCREAKIRRCRVRHGQNGALLTRCTKSFVYDNDFSFNSGWGIALYRTTHTEVSHNRCDFCVRGYSHGVYYRGQDSAGILVFEQSSHNVFVKNSATHSGDGFFLYAGHETTQRTGKGGCNHNLVWWNDFDYAVANGIEATFSQGNIFWNNSCGHADHGIWAGYSHNSQFLSNHASECLTAGISIEHGHENVIAENTATGARYGIHLWWDEDEQFLKSVYGREQDCDSKASRVQQNVLAGTVAALRLVGDRDSHVDRNHFPLPLGGTAVVHMGAGTSVASFAGNRIDGDLLVQNDTGKPVTLAGTNSIQGVLRHDGEPAVVDPRLMPSVPNLAPSVEWPEVKGSHPVTQWRPGELCGRDQIRIDEWGPIDPREARLFPTWQAAAGGEAKVHLLGHGPYEVVERSEGVVVEPAEGNAPATLSVRCVGAGPVFRKFRVVVAIDGKRLPAEGSLVHMRWDVRWFQWDAASDPVSQPEAFAALLAGSADMGVRTLAIDWPWRGEGPPRIEPDHFATLARSSVELPAGRWRVRVVSDDGVRLFVDGMKVIERWDRHVPTEDVAELELEAGTHAFRLEHFEIDGWAWLSLRLEPAD